MLPDRRGLVCHHIKLYFGNVQPAPIFVDIMDFQPFAVTANRKNTYGRLSRFTDPKLAAEEAGAYERAMVEKHEKTD